MTFLLKLLSGTPGRHLLQVGTHPEAMRAQNKVLESLSSPPTLLPSLHRLPEPSGRGGRDSGLRSSSAAGHFNIPSVQKPDVPSPCTPAFLPRQEALPRPSHAPWMPSLLGTPHTHRDPHGASPQPSGAGTFSSATFLFCSLQAAHSFPAACPLEDEVSLSSVQAVSCCWCSRGARAGDGLCSISLLSSASPLPLLLSHLFFELFAHVV